MTSFAAGGCHYPKNCRIHHKKSCKGCGFIHHIFTNCGLIANDGRTTIIRWSSPADNRFSTSVDAPIDGGCPQNPVVSHKFPHSNGRFLDIPKSIHLFPWYPHEVVGCIRHLCGFNSPFLKHLGVMVFLCVYTSPNGDFNRESDGINDIMWGLSYFHTNPFPSISIVGSGDSLLILVGQLRFYPPLKIPLLQLSPL